jgi:hypothetical protein
MDQLQFLTSVRFVGNLSQQNQPQSPLTAIKELINDEGGQYETAYPLLGSGSDLAVVARFPSVTAAMKAWLAVNHRYGWTTRTNPVCTPAEFEQIFGQIVAQTSATGHKQIAGR